MVTISKTEVADMQKQIKALRTKMEAADVSIPEFGGSPSKVGAVEAADMSADERHKNFGDFGKWDAIFHGANSASKFRK